MVEATQTQAILSKPALLVDGVRHEMPIGVFRVGRDPQNHLVLQDTSLSRVHCVIDVYIHQAQLIDVGSSNGTFVNKRRVHSAWLKDGDRIRIGDHILLFQAPGFVLNQEHADDLEHTYAVGPKKLFEISWLPLLALFVASASLFMQLVNRERQMEQDQEIKTMWTKVNTPPVAIPVVVEQAKEKPEEPEKRWQKALMEFKSGGEEEACESIKKLIPELDSKNLLKAKARSFFERKCVF